MNSVISEIKIVEFGGRYIASYASYKSYDPLPELSGPIKTKELSRSDKKYLDKLISFAKRNTTKCGSSSPAITTSKK